MDSKELIKKYNNLLKKQKDSEAKLIELRTQYKVAKEELDSVFEQLKTEFNVSSIEEANELLEQYKFDIEMELNNLEEEVRKLDTL
jgi:F0F1-type ATP synthase membrane subunit b/b'